MRCFALFFLAMFLLNSLCALCLEGQIDINTASAEELDKITEVGNATALKIIAERPFSSVNDLVKVKGIKDITLEKIKTQGLACVDNSYSSSVNKEETTSEEPEETKVSKAPKDNPSNSEEDKEKNVKEYIPLETNLTKPPAKTTELQMIKLNSDDAKDIKDNSSIQENTEEKQIEKYSGFGLVALFLILVVLLSLQKRKNGLE